MRVYQRHPIAQPQRDFHVSESVIENSSKCNEDAMSMTTVKPGKTHGTSPHEKKKPRLRRSLGGGTSNIITKLSFMNTHLDYDEVFLMEGKQTV